MSKFFQGTLILLVAGFITKILGFINRIVVARIIGGEGVGLYMMALPSLFLVITITQLGLPVAIAKYVAEANAARDEKRIRKILVVSLATTVSISLVFTPALIMLAPWLSTVLFTDSRVLLPLIAIAPIIPIAAVSAVIRGYFQGKQNMRPSAYSQILEQASRIVLIYFMTNAFLPYGIEYAAAAALFSSVIGELISLLYLLTLFKIHKRFRLRKRFFASVAKGRDTLKQLLGIALPSTGSRLISNISWFFEPIIVAQSLAIAGVSATLATRQYGELMGYAWPLLMLPSFIMSALSTSLVPAVSEADARGNMGLVARRLHQSLRITFITGCLAVVILFVFADPIMNVMYGKTNAAIYITFLAPIFIFAYYQMPLQAVLQAMNMAKSAMVNSTVGAVVKLSMIFILSSQPQFGIMGTAIGIGCGIVAVTFLHFATIAKRIQLSLNIKSYLMILAAAFLAGAAGKMLYANLEHSLSLYLSIGCLCITYAFILFASRTVTKAEVMSFFMPGRKK